MSNVPKPPKNDQITWFENHIPLWSSSPSTYGITPAALLVVSNATTAARAAYIAAQNSKQATKNAVVFQDSQVETMLGVGRDLVNVIKAHIQNSNNPALWGQAGLTPPASPGTAPDPVAPYQLGASLDSQGNLIVKWKTSQPTGVSGVVYFLRRSIDNGPFTLVHTTGEKEFIDASVPAGTASVSYAIQAKRGQKVSSWSETLTVRFGQAGMGAAGGIGGWTITSSPTGGSIDNPGDDVKLAA